MRITARTLVVAAAVLLSPVSTLRAQSPVDPSGHWEGAVTIPTATLPFTIDLARDHNGELIGTLSGTDVKNLPLTKIAVDGRSVRLQASAEQPFTGMLATDGKSMFGTVILSGYPLPLELRRTGEGKVEPPPTSARVSTQIEGTWNGSLELAGKLLRVVLTIENQPDGRARAHLLSLDEGGLVIPIIVTQQGSGVAYTSQSIPGSWNGVLSVDGMELAGTYVKGNTSLPLVFHRSATEAAK